jgi:trk system potassium uptake protein TrkH
VTDVELAASRRLRAARLGGAAALALLGLLAVDAPGGYFGPSGTLTDVGLLYAAVVVLLSGLGALLWVRGSRLHRTVAPAALTLNIAAFVVPLASDPVVAGLVVGWNLVLLARFLLAQPQEPLDRLTRVVFEPDDSIARWLALNGLAARHLLAVALLATVAVVGYGVGSDTGARTATLIGDIAVLAALLPVLLDQMRRGSRGPWLVVALTVAGLISVSRPTLSLSLVAAALLVASLWLASRTRVHAEVIDHFLDRPALLVFVSFLSLISLGTLLLSLPAASADGSPVAPLNALFTATSASCVTGLIVLDTAHAFSTFGHAVILLLIQAGGLNIMVLSTFAAILIGRGLGLRGERALGELLDIRAPRAAYRLIRFIVIGTIVVEAVGAVALGSAYMRHGDEFLSSIWKGIFHAVSAFCNAGFALQSDSLVMFQHDPLVLLVMGSLITVGGLGFAVVAFAWLRLTGQRRIGLAIQVRIVLWTSLALVVVGWLGYGLLEWNRSLAGLQVGGKVLNAFFQSVTARTAGFNSVPLLDLGPATMLLLMVLMFVGASPGGTGGGIKTTTLVVLLSAIPTMAHGRPEVTVAGRQITAETIFRSSAILVMASLVVVIGSLLLLSTQNISFDAVLFETVSAFGTVGLSRGATALIDGFGKAVIIMIMLVGRVGPLTLALLLVRRGTGRIGYPQTGIMVG